MRKVFHQYFRPTQEELGELWTHGLFSFDASVLLNLYGYSSETRDGLVEFIERNADRVRLAHQFGLEYARNRSGVIIKQVGNYQKVEKELCRIKDQDIAPKRDHPYLTKESLEKFEAIQKELARSREILEKFVGSDPYADKLLRVFEGKVTNCLTSEELSQREVEAKERYDKRIPPGFADLKEKAIPEAYGDFIGWHELLQIAKAEQKGIILVIDDFKEDWWQIERERTLGPRPELLEEFARLTQQKFWMYNSENFLRAAKEFTAADIREDVIEEVSLRLASQRAMQLAPELKSAPIEGEPSEPEKPNVEKPEVEKPPAAEDKVKDFKAAFNREADKPSPEIE